jgi:hypothetical protein
MRTPCRAALFLAACMAALPSGAWGGKIDLDKPEKDVIYLDNPWGGSPIVSSEIGAEPQAMGDPETMNPVYGTCLMPGVVPSECSPDCAFKCDTPECSLNCFCACPEGKALRTQMLAQAWQRTQVLAAREDFGNAEFWKDALHTLKLDEKKAAASATALKVQEANEKRRASPRFKAHQLLVEKQRAAKLERAKARAGKRPRVDIHGHTISATRDPFAEADGFSWEKYHPVNPYRVRGRSRKPTEIDREVDRIDNVFDPSEDFDNAGGEEPFAAAEGEVGARGGRDTAWWGFKSKEPAYVRATEGHWWTHEPKGDLTAGEPSPFGTADNDHTLGWF